MGLLALFLKIGDNDKFTVGDNLRKILYDKALCLL